MKTKIIVLLALMLTTINLAQNTEIQTPVIDEVVSNVETQPVPFQLADVPPLARDCKTKWKLEKRQKCTRSFINNHVNQKFNTELVSELGLMGRIKIDVSFTIDKEGRPKNISATGGPEMMNLHAIEVIQILPQLSPAMHNGKLVEVAYRLPIVFDIV